MVRDVHLNDIRMKLFYGLLDYTKSFPDFCIPQRFSPASPREGDRLLEQIDSSLREERQILLYVHLPFCCSKCVFCNSFPQNANRDVQAQYVDGLLREIEIYANSGIFRGKEAKCVYFGGGTPTAFETGDIERILSRIASCVSLAEGCDITVEAHPKDLVEKSRSKELLKLGIHRTSMGCQTFDCRVLELCKRSNPEEQVRAAIENAKGVGLATNLDMMIGLPGQTLEGVKRDLEILAEVRPRSIEYMRHEIVNPLAVSLYRGNPELLVDDDALFWMVYQTQTWIDENGYEQNGWFRSEEQFPYRYHWLDEVPFIALGSRSRSCTKAVCYDKHDDLAVYLQLTYKGMLPAARYMVLSETEQMYRSLFLGLQMRKGLELAGFSNRFGASAPSVFSSLLKRLTEYGCVVVDESAIRLTKYGRYFVEDVCCLIIDHALKEWGDSGRLGRIPHSSGGLLRALRSRLKAPESR
ncbi:MAG: coproporphyrinogen-III oxidase family protein [Planctomycetota bacterium]|jgi:oxygen-independent coproporphyrinogen-3 oxidase